MDIFMMWISTQPVHIVQVQAGLMTVWQVQLHMERQMQRLGIRFLIIREQRLAVQSLMMEM